MDTGRLDKIVKDLERLQRDADGIIDSFVDYKIANAPHTSFGQSKSYFACRHAGSTLDRVAALRHVKHELTK
jgi:hypothetical protein